MKQSHITALEREVLTAHPSALVSWADDLGGLLGVSVGPLAARWCSTSLSLSSPNLLARVHAYSSDECKGQSWPTRAFPSRWLACANILLLTHCQPERMLCNYLVKNIGTGI